VGSALLKENSYFLDGVARNVLHSFVFNVLNHLITKDYVLNLINLFIKHYYSIRVMHVANQFKKKDGDAMSAIVICVIIV
jgi:hypothetical protein